MISLLIIGCGLVVISFLLCSFHLFNYLLAIESFNVIVLLVSLSVGEVIGCYTLFISMMALFVIEVSLLLIVVGVVVSRGCLRVSLGL
uniref:NADH dehydrogenase subunit 4L n=1 Tax=Schistosoma turkestanicum TaxID=1163369 RepID=G4WCQ2_9TREM|nr:NADH dehydrogenase subunit 4L [Schistosoma turkestanicum]